MPRSGPSSWCEGLPRFDVAPQVGVMESPASVCPSSWGDGLQRFGMASRVWLIESPPFARRLGLGSP